MIKKIFILLFLILLTAYLAMAVTVFNDRPTQQNCKGMDLVINDSVDYGFITQKEILKVLSNKKLSPIGKSMTEVNTREIEDELRKHPLIANAIKFTEPGGRILLRQEKEGDEVIVTVSDTGCGMSEETMAHIFDKFYQGDTSHSGEGNGLGLSLARRVLEISGGSIAVRSAPGEGAEFIVRLKRIVEA